MLLNPLLRLIWLAMISKNTIDITQTDIKIRNESKKLEKIPKFGNELTKNAKLRLGVMLEVFRILMRKKKTEFIKLGNGYRPLGVEKFMGIDTRNNDIDIMQTHIRIHPNPLSKKNTGSDDNKIVISQTGYSLTILPSGEVKGSHDLRNQNSVVQVIHVYAGIVHIKGISTQRYLGMDASSNVISTPHVTDENLFILTIHENNYTSLKSYKYGGHNWYLGINRRGRMIKGRNTVFGTKPTMFLIAPQHS
ncbi:unnamed protein product [Owenia fusiformis]|uniref:Uncharacterized protein n=1 Tax=Owenia fusiformis TaxID=6347 RepID=A0A8J1TEM6_OWEFU|nr:unnamed protein product [Owenia fusiformis]